IEGHGLSHIQFQNGVQGLLITGQGANGSMLNRLLGSEGIIEVGRDRDAPLRMWGTGQGGWVSVPVEEDIHGQEYVKRGVLDLIDALKTGREPELSARKALQATELIFATYESSRRRGRVDLPLDITDHPMVSMVEQGVMSES
ncbi:MAG: gfo/Idh/MocA family oxidoreductase, partial [Caldilineae bacterium]